MATATGTATWNTRRSPGRRRFWWVARLRVYSQYLLGCRKAETVKDALITIWSEITARTDGPLAMRFYVQPLMATILAIRDGLEDARAGHPPYFWSLFTDPGWTRVG